ncbi:MAG: penicillin-binding transpeptidase domain-containing protein [Terracidiphilus sp.]
MATAVRAIRSRVTTPRAVPLRRRRFWLICLFFLVWACAIAGRLFWLQIVRHKEYVERAEKQQQRTFEVAPRRGVLYDRNLHELAMTVLVDSIYADPSEIEDKQAAARTLSAIAHTDPEDARTTEKAIAERLNAGHNFAWVARRVTPAVAAQVRALNMKGIYFQKEFERFYPDNQIAAQVLGYVGVDDNGLGGLEEKFDADLHGVPGEMYAAMDARRKVLGSTEREPEAGRNLVLTIDENIQFMAEKALDHAMEKTQAINGTVVVQDVHTGQILALAIRPTFNPNQFRHTTPALLRDHAVSDVYEPGSVFKLVTYSTALDQGTVKPDDTIDCQGGKITLAGRVIHDNQGEHYGVIPVHQALEVSSDVAAVKLALRVGPDRFYQYIRSFGFGSRSGIELPGETRGLLLPVKCPDPSTIHSRSRVPRCWGPTSIGSIAIGQEVAVTPLQLVTMVSTIANGGVYLPPHILMQEPSPPANPNQNAAAPQVPPQVAQVAVPFKPGGDIPDPLPAGAHRVISTLTAAEMRQMMEGVVLFGTGKPAQLNGYSSAGKTGTAQKIDPRTHLYSKTMHIASFAGFAPVNNPVISVAVVMDSPKGDYYGTAVSAPIFAEVAQQVLEYLGVPHDIDLKPPTTAAKKEAPVTEDDSAPPQEDIQALYEAANDLPSDDPQSAAASQPATAVASSASPPAPSPGTPANTQAGGISPRPAAIAPPSAVQPSGNAAQSGTTTIQLPDANQLRVPSLLGLPVRQVIEQAGAAGLEVEITGSGICNEQAPAPGAMVAPGTKIVVRCAR